VALARAPPRGYFYSAAYTASRPKPPLRETRLLRSKDGVKWDLVSSVTQKHMAGEADMDFPREGGVRMLSRTGDDKGKAYWFRSNGEMKEWTESDSGVLFTRRYLARAGPVCRWRARQDECRLCDALLASRRTKSDRIDHGAQLRRHILSGLDCGAAGEGRKPLAPCQLVLAIRVRERRESDLGICGAIALDGA